MNDKKNTIAGQISKYALYLALAFIFGYIEAILPFNLWIPGAKLGFSNIIIVYVLYMSGSLKSTLIIMLAKVLLTGFTFGNPSMILYSLCGGFLSVTLMYLLYLSKHFSTYAVSMAGGAFHNIGQLLCAGLMFENMGLLYYMPAIILAGMLTGLFIGLLSEICIKRMKKFNNNN